jgi:hypothetical protein
MMPAMIVRMSIPPKASGGIVAESRPSHASPRSAAVIVPMKRGRTNIGTVNLNANELKFAADGSLTLHMSREVPAEANATANWLPTPEGQFALIVRAYVPTKPILDGSYKLPNVERK